jgi:hypothetical protein
MNLTDIQPGDLVFNIWKPNEPLIVLGPTRCSHLTSYQISSVTCLKPNGTTESINKNNLRPSQE